MSGYIWRVAVLKGEGPIWKESRPWKLHIHLRSSKAGTLSVLQTLRLVHPFTQNSSSSHFYARSPRASNSGHVEICGNAFVKICPLRCPVERKAEEENWRKRYR